MSRGNMPAKLVARPKTRPQLQTGTAVGADPATMSRLLGDLATAVQRTESTAKDRTRITVDLAVGANHVNHGLGRPAIGVTLTPTVADASFAWAMTASDSQQITVTVIGVPQPKCPLEVY